MTAAEIGEYQKMKNIRLHGYTSCSLAKNVALSFAWENPKSGHQKVLFHIQWMSKW